MFSKSTVSIAVTVIAIVAAVLAVVFLLLPAASEYDKAQVVDTSQKSTKKDTPALKTELVATNLNHPWAVAFLPDNTLIFTERDGDISKVVDDEKITIHHPDDVYVRGEGGMLGLAVDPAFDQNRYIYTCFNSTKDSLDVRVVRWKIDTEVASLSERMDIVTGIPSSESGRHSGCRIGFGVDGNLWIGTGDAAQAENPQNLKNLGGKILRVDRDGQGVQGNIGGEADPRIFSYGHRNTQGLAFYDEVKDGSYGLSVEHGPGIDDEINSLIKGNFGWSPLAPYGEGVPMTDTARFPKAISSIWNSGSPTLATSDADFIKGEHWGGWENRLAVATLKARHLRLIEIKPDGTLGEQLRLFDDIFGRLRAATMHTDGSLYVSTDNGGSEDVIIRISPEN